MKFVHLHAHSTYSILDAWGRPEEIVERLVEAKLEAHVLTDHDSVSGHIKFDKEMRKAGLKPIFGIEIRVVDNLEQREWKSEEGRRFYPYHLGLIAENAIGYQNLMKLTTLAWSQGIGGRGKYMPVVTWNDIRQHNEGLIGTSGCLSGKISRAILGQIEDDPEDVIKQMTKVFRKGKFFLEWQNLHLDACKTVAKVLSKYPNSIVTHDVHFPTKDKRGAQNIMAAIMRWKKVVGPDGQGPMEENCYLASADEVVSICKEIGVVSKEDLKRSMRNTVKVADSCNVTLPKIEMVRYLLPEGEPNAVDYMKKLLNEGWKKRRLDKLKGAERKMYLDRLRYEFDIIERKDFIDYFLIITDISHFCVREDILKGPARGSSAGSLVAWCLEITEVDPLKHGLIFERFIDMNRMDWPDIDMDFPDDRREEIHEYLSERYGKENVGYIGTFTTFKAKNALDDVARVHELPHWVTAKIKPYIPDRSHGDVRSHLTLTDAMDSFDEVKEVVKQFPDIRKAIELEGQFRGMGVHPAGFVVASQPLNEVVPIYEISGKDRVIGLDMNDAAAAGMVKIDVLGLKTMTALAHSRDAIRERHGVDVDFYNLPLDDEIAMKGFTETDVLGIFQFGGKATKNLIRQIRPTKFAELVDINTLSRPGAMLAGTSDQYVAIHTGRKSALFGRLGDESAKATPVHPIIDEITKDTHNLVLYQEQVLRIMREFGGLDWQISSEIRKFMSKRMGVEILEKFWPPFRDGAAEKGISEELARDVWLRTSTFGAYGFNKSHSVSYSMISYWQMWVKRHYPTEFYFSALAVEGDKDKRNLYIQEAKRSGVKFLPVDPNRSTKTFSLEPDGIRYGLTQVQGIGDKSAELMMEARPFKGWDDVRAIRGVGDKTIELFKSALGKGDDLFDLVIDHERVNERREAVGAISMTQLMAIVNEGSIDTKKEHTVAGHVISKNFRQEEKLSLQVKDKAKAGAKSSTVIVYLRDSSGESFPVVIPGWLAVRKTKEIWEDQSGDIYIIRGRLPDHGKFFLANGISNTDYQNRMGNNEADTGQQQLKFA